MTTISTFLMTPGFWLCILLMVLSGISINYHNRLCNENKDNCNKFEPGFIISVITIVISVFGIVWYFYKANKENVHSFAKLAGEHGKIMADKAAEHGQIMAKKTAEHAQIMADTAAKNSSNLSKQFVDTAAKHGQIMADTAAKHGKNLVDTASKHSSNLSKQFVNIIDKSKDTQMVYGY